MPVLSPPVPQPTAKKQGYEFKLFVTLLNMRLLTKCHVLKDQNQDEWVTHIKPREPDNGGGYYHIRLLPIC